MHKPYQEVLGHPADFRVLYCFYTAAEGGRRNPPGQGYRSDFRYFENWADHHDVFMIWPEFEDERGNVIVDEASFPVPAIGTARMWIINAGMRKLHRQRIRTGTKGFFMEGTVKVAECEVVEVLGLMSNPTENRSR
jgi:hypothetical protein